ncbi:hypothetical protein ZOSMA_85G00620 [Zostera marina]|uniref:Transmembrane protein n=1 Tax=Zostera marina TaxID=29655 RepID=A0A0K9NL41_ZOSMR|nr:hypothetical protein ZOSMA_85G00620 [Zostera marina]
MDACDVEKGCGSKIPMLSSFTVSTAHGLGFRAIIVILNIFTLSTPLFFDFCILF